MAASRSATDGKAGQRSRALGEPGESRRVRHVGGDPLDGGMGGAGTPVGSPRGPLAMKQDNDFSFRSTGGHRTSAGQCPEVASTRNSHRDEDFNSSVSELAQVTT